MSRTHQAEAVGIRQMRPDEAGSCEAILRALPDWFGLESSIVQYRRDLEEMDTYVADFDGTVVGFLTLVQHNSYTAEIHVIAVDPRYHRHGLGRALVAHTEQILAQRAISYLEVKTLGPSRPDEFYGRTHAFYIAMGFCPVEENKLWARIILV